MQMEDFLNKMLVFLPSTTKKYHESVEYFGEVLGTIIIEDIFMPDIIKLLSENKNVELLKTIFSYFEDVSNNAEMDLLNDFSVTVLELLGNDKEILKVAQTYMGPKTTELQIEADRDLGRI